jgi:tetratricopeptide (TPR) repeat protein
MRNKSYFTCLSFNSIASFAGEKMNPFRFILFVCLFIFTFFLDSYCFANLKDDQKKAAEFIELEMYPQAIALLEKVVQGNKEDSEAYFQLGICNARLGNFSESEKWFSRAIQSNTDYAYKIANVYVEAASYLRSKNNNFDAVLAVEKAKLYDPNIEKEIEKRYLKEVDINGNLKMSTYDINSKFIDNNNVGRLFVIFGKVKNGYLVSRGNVTLEGKIFSAGKILVQEEKVYCGNVISDFELTNLKWDGIKAKMANEIGETRNNVKIEPGESIPFMVVFSGLPQDLEEFTIEVISSKEP